MSRPDWQQRVIEERIEVTRRADKLEAFLKNEGRPDVDPQDEILLQIQLAAMQAYILALQARIDRLPK